MFAAKAKKYVGVAAALSLTAVVAVAQEKTEVATLKQIATEQAALAKAQKVEAVRLAHLLGLPLKGKLANGSQYELMRFEGSVPIYYVTANLGAAQTVGATKVWPGGVTGLNLTGEGIVLREWDSGSARLTHQELTGRAVSPDSADVQNHSTHVAGTMIATGVDPNAKGMSYKATLRTFDWTNDMSEMAAEGAAGALLSNHSYRSYYYGYSSDCITRDNISYNAPYYLICQAGGNEGPDYRTLGSPSCAKNGLTVAAVLKHTTGYGGPDTVQIAGFSSRGPTPDGRIKPDISAPGVDLYSCNWDGDNTYQLMSGTSMATPCACGNLGLVAQYYAQTHSGTNMRSSTLKALAIHTADEAGPADGPDFNYGWGQLNTNAACVVIKEALTRPEEIQEQTLNSGETFSYPVGCDGVQPIKVTLCWIDPAGPDIGDTTTPALVNDLDLRVTNNGVTYKPWKLDNTNPDAPATKDDNTVDNVEQVVFQPTAGTVTITVTAKNTTLSPSGQQKFSLIVTGAISPSMTGMSIDRSSLANGESANGTVTLDMPAPSSGTRVTITNSNKNALTCPTLVTVPAGLTSGAFTVTAKAVLEPTTATVTATYNGQSYSQTLTIGPSWLTSLTVNPTTVNGGATSLATVSLGKAAGEGGATINISSSNTAAATVNPTVVIPEGETSATFTVTTKPVSTAAIVTLRASYPGPTVYATLTVMPTMGVSSLAIKPASLRGGATAKGTVMLTMTAPQNLYVTLNTDTSLATAPSTVLIKKGARSATFSIRTSRTKVKTTATVTASYAGTSQSAYLTINP